MKLRINYTFIFNISQKKNHQFVCRMWVVVGLIQVYPSVLVLPPSWGCRSWVVGCELWVVVGIILVSSFTVHACWHVYCGHVPAVNTPVCIQWASLPQHAHWHAYSHFLNFTLNQGPTQCETGFSFREPVSEVSVMPLSSERFYNMVGTDFIKPLLLDINDAIVMWKYTSKVLKYKWKKITITPSKSPRRVLWRQCMVVRMVFSTHH